MWVYLLRLGRATIPYHSVTMKPMVKIRLRQGISGLFFVGCILVFPYPVVSLDPSLPPCNNPESCFSEFVRELDKLDFASPASFKAEKLFHQLITIHAETPWATWARLRYGYALRIVRPVKAIPLLRASLTEVSVLADYLHYWLLQAYEHAGLLQEAATLVLAFTDGHLESRVRVAMLYEGGALFSKAGKCQMARSVLSQALAESPKHPNAPSALFQLGTCAGLLGQQEKMVEIFRELWWRFPLAQESVQAQLWVAQENAGVFVPTIEEQFQRAMSFYKGGALKKAINDFEKVLAVSKKTPQYFKSQLTSAKAWVRLKQYDQAEIVLQKLTQSSSSRQDDAWVWLGRSYLRHGKGEALGNLVKILPTDRLTADQQAQIHTFHGIWLQDHDRWPEAIQAYQNAFRVAQTGSKKLNALWQVGWIQYQNEQFDEAVDIFQKIIQQTENPQSTFFRHAFSQAWYWLARSEEQMGHIVLASQHFKQLNQAYPFTYYGQLAQIRLGETNGQSPSWTVFAAMDSPKKGISPQLKQDLHFQKIQVLQAVQLSKEAVQELEQVYSRYGSDAEIFQELASLAAETEAYDIGIRLAIRHFGSTLRTGQLPPASPAWSGAFPMGYQHMIQSFVPRHVDPFLVAGLIREESLYSARVVSPVGAIGLMQLMPATAKRVASHLNLTDSKFETNWLYEPHHNIQLGTHFLGQLLDEFQGNIIYSVAAYNAGPQAVQRWMAQYGQRPADEFVELIGYKETRRYVKRVVGSYRIYRMLSGKTCPPISLDRFC